MINMMRILIFSSYLCFVHTSFLGTLEILDWNKAIKEQSLFKEIFPVSLIECAKQCLSRPSTCQSFNYRRTLLLCQLSDSNDTSLVENTPSTVHSLISKWPRDLIGNCAKITCPKRNRCDERDASCKLSECDIIPEYPDMEAKNFDRSIGFVVEYECSKERYVSNGKMNIVCQRNGTWSSLEGNCVLGYCEDPPIVVNSIITFGSNKLGATREYICNTLYFMTGKSTITCQMNGHWTTPDLVCHERCPISKGFRYIKEQDTCYKIKHQATSHDEAEKECYLESSTLITIRSKTMQDLVNSELLRIDNFSFYGYHIDAIYDSQHRTWIDKNGRKLVYDDWNKDPESVNSGMNHCVVVVNTSKWSSEPCSVLALPVCEYDKCPTSYQIYPNLNLCYKVHDSHKVNRTEAKRECKENDGHLLVIDNENIQTFIENVDNTATTIQVPIQYTTSDAYTYTLLTEYGYNVDYSTSITLWIKACNDAHVGLMSENNKYSTKFYEIVIGGWGGTKSVIRPQKQSHTSLDTFDNDEVLSCLEFRKFTFSWTSGIIQVYNGDGARILEYSDPNHYQVNFIGVTGGIWASVTFQIYTEEFFWISGQRINGVWIDDHDRNMSYFKWNTGQPDEVTSAIGISIRKVNVLGREYWFDNKQSQKHFFICEYS